MSAKNCVPVRIRGNVYPSVTAAAKAFRVKPSTVSSQLARYGTADGVGLGCKSPRHNSTGHHVKPVVILGRAFPSIKAASDFFGVSYSWLYKALTKDSPSNWQDRLLAALMAVDARKAAAALKRADMTDRINKRAA